MSNSYQIIYKPSYKSDYIYDQFGVDYSTELPIKLLEKANLTTIDHVRDHVYNLSELDGFISHGIHDKIQVIMIILKTKKLSPQINMINKNLSQLTIYGDIVQENRTSFGVIGDGTMSKLYGQNGFSFISNKLQVYRAKSHMPYEFFIDDDIPLADLVLTLDKNLACKKISSLKCTDIRNEYRKNNEIIRDAIVQFLIDETKLNPLEVIDTNEKFDEYYHKCLQYIVNPTNPTDCTIKELVISLLEKYDNPIKLIIIDY